jgi:hypothetical protein
LPSDSATVILHTNKGGNWQLSGMAHGGRAPRHGRARGGARRRQPPPGARLRRPLATRRTFKTGHSSTRTARRPFDSRKTVRISYYLFNRHIHKPTISVISVAISITSLIIPGRSITSKLNAAAQYAQHRGKAPCTTKGCVGNCDAPAAPHVGRDDGGCPLGNGASAAGAPQPPRHGGGGSAACTAPGGAAGDGQRTGHAGEWVLCTDGGELLLSHAPPSHGAFANDVCRCGIWSELFSCQWAPALRVGKGRTPSAHHASIASAVIASAASPAAVRRRPTPSPLPLPAPPGLQLLPTLLPPS